MRTQHQHTLEGEEDSSSDGSTVLIDEHGYHKGSQRHN